MDQTLNIALTGLVLAQTILLGTLAWLFRAKVQEINGIIRAFVTPKGPDQASPLADVVDVGADMVARAVMARAKTTFMGQASGAIRQEKAVDGAIAEDVARASHPLAGTLLDAMPELRKTLRKNPQLLDFALSKLGGMMANKESGGAAGVVLSAGKPNPNRNGGGKING